MQTLNDKISVTRLPSILELEDGSFELVVHISVLENKLGTLLPGSTIDKQYNPFEPTAWAIKEYGYDIAKKLCREWLYGRAQKQKEQGWSTSADFYAYFLVGAGSVYRFEIRVPDATELVEYVYQLRKGSTPRPADVSRHIIACCEPKSVTTSQRSDGTAT